VYFRKTIPLARPPDAATVQVRFDDGYALYVNGNLVSQRNTGRGLAHNLYASASTDNELVTEALPAGVFVAGDNTLAVMVKQVGPTSPDLSFDLGLELLDDGTGGTGSTGGAGGSPGSDGFGFGATWRYLDSGLDPGPSWYAPGFDDSAWRSGAGQLGYGDGDEATMLARTTPSQTSVYFRRHFPLSATPGTAALSLLFDDGLAVYVNGTPVFSYNVGRGLQHTAYASASEENRTLEVSIPANVLVPGDNVIAVMVKQVGPTSPDISFDLGLRLGP
jgi:hypothetical protein